MQVFSSGSKVDLVLKQELHLTKRSSPCLRYFTRPVLSDNHSVLLLPLD
ncbi:hypothetical protein Hdeb2414_s0780g00946291 [Helianthus debilis subsp. tardiflorus]